MVNYGNTCYANAFLAALANIQSFVKNLRSGAWIQVTEGETSPLYDALEHRDAAGAREVHATRILGGRAGSCGSSRRKIRRRRGKRRGRGAGAGGHARARRDAAGLISILIGGGVVWHRGTRAAATGVAAAAADVGAAATAVVVRDEKRGGRNGRAGGAPGRADKIHVFSFSFFFL